MSRGLFVGEQRHPLSAPRDKNRASLQAFQKDQVLWFRVTEATTPAGTQITGFSWRLGDGTTAEGDSVLHTYTDAGSYPVALKVTNDVRNSTTTRGGCALRRCAVASVRRRA